MLYPNDLPYLKTLTKKVYLPIGKPIGRGNLIFLYSNSIENSIKMMNEQTTFTGNNRYYYYYYNLIYVGKIYNKRYRLRDTERRKEIYEKIEKRTNIHPYMLVNHIRENENKNMYYDLCQHINIYNSITNSLNPFRKIPLFWDYIKSIILMNYGQYEKKYILINANDFKNFKGKLKDTINNPLYMLYFTLYKYFNLISNLDIDILIYCNGKVLKVNPSLCDEKSYKIFLREVKKIYSVATLDVETISNDEIDSEIIKSETEQNISNKITPTEVVDINKVEKQRKITSKINGISNQNISLMSKNLYNVAANVANISNKITNTINTNDILSKTNTDISEKINKKVDKVVRDMNKDIKSVAGPDASITDAKTVNKDIIQKKVETEIEDDKELMEEIYNNLKKDTLPTKSQASSARDQLLREKQKDIKIGELTLADLEKIRPDEVVIETKDVSNITKTTNENMKHIRFNNFEKSYNESMMNKDIIGTFTELNDKSIPCFLRDVKIVDSSDKLNYKDTYTFYLEDGNRNRHTITVDIPKFIDDRFLYLGGNKKLILHQNFFLPLVKIAPDTVQIVTNTNKMTIKRVDTKSLRGIEILLKAIEKSDSIKTRFTFINCIGNNEGYLTTVEIDEFSKIVSKFKEHNTLIMFNQQEATMYAEKNQIKIPKNKIFIGMEAYEPLFIDPETGKDLKGRTICDIMVSCFNDDEKSVYKSIKTPRRLMYSKVTIMAKDIAIMPLMCLWEGLSTVLKKSKIEYRLVQKLSEIGLNEPYIKFANCFLVYDQSIHSELLMNGFRALDTTGYEISAFDDPTTYIDYIKKIYGKINILNALDNSHEFMIDHITKEVLMDLNLPTDLVELMCHANMLLSDSQYKYQVDQSLSRVRSNEIIPAILYEKIARAYVVFKNSNGRKKLSVPQDCVIKELLAQKTVEDVSDLNPILELERTHAVTSKGWRGVNLDRSYTVPNRSYDKSMIGIIAPTTSPDASVGVSRTLSMEPNLKSVRGYSDTKDDLTDVKDINLFSPGELLVPLGVTRDDPTRTGHAIKQSKHMIPIVNSSPVLISNGAEEICRFYLSSVFVVNAKMDGFVKEYDDKTKIMIVEYKDGSHQAIDLGKNIVKNGGGGFFLSNSLTTDLKVGDKFKANQCLAWHKNFFTNNKTQGTRMNMGVLAKVALMSTYDTYEDSTFITQKLSKDAITEMCFCKQAVLGKNSNIYYMVKVGDKIKVGDSLIHFDESYEENDLNKLLANLGDNEDEKNELLNGSRNIIPSKYSGVIEDIKMYSTVDLEELSPSLQKIFGAYYNKIKRKDALLSKYDKTGSVVKCGILLNDATGKVEPNRYGVIKGQKVEDGVLIEFYIKHSEPLEVGSKIAMFTGLKNTIGEVIEEGYEPYSFYRPEEEVSSIIASNSILKRMVPSVILTTLGNKCIVELKRHLQDIWNKTQNQQMRRTNMCNLIYKFFSAFDKSGDNTKKYKDMFTPMSDVAFDSFFRQFFSDEKQYLILDIIDYERTIKLEDIEDAAKVINIPLYEYVALPWITMDKNNIIVTKQKVPVGYINIKRTQQTVAKKNGISTSINQRSAITGQVTGADKNGRESDLENNMLISLGLESTLKELNGPRADDLVMKQQMLKSISEKGYLSLSELDDKIENKTTLNTVNTYFLGMGLNTDLVTKGLKLASTLRNE